jgi:hypothetical protein
LDAACRERVELSDCIPTKAPAGDAIRDGLWICDCLLGEPTTDLTGFGKSGRSLKYSGFKVPRSSENHRRKRRKDDDDYHFGNGIEATVRMFAHVPFIGGNSKVWAIAE